MMRDYMCAKEANLQPQKWICVYMRPGLGTRSDSRDVGFFLATWRVAGGGRGSAQLCHYDLIHRALHLKQVKFIHKFKTQ